MTKPRYEDFAYTGRTLEGNLIDDVAVQRTAEARTRTDAPSGDGEQQLGVFTTTPESLISPEIIIRATAFSDDNGRPEGGLFDAYVAEATGRRVMAVNAPGVDYFGDDVAKKLGRLTPDQLEDLKRRGSFQKVGAASMQSLYNAAIMNGEIDPSFIVSASSMGVAIGAGMLQEAYDKNIDISGVVLAEPVNHTKRPTAKLGLQFAKTNGNAPGYIEMNPQPIIDNSETMSFWAKRVVEGRTANWAYARALGAGTFQADLGGIDGLADTKPGLYITNGTASRLSSDASGRDMKQFLEQFASVDSLQHDAFVGHDHPYTMAVQSVVDGVGKVAKR